MKKYLIFLFLFCLLLATPEETRAQDFYLGDWEKNDFLNKIPEKINLEINGLNFNLTRTEIAPWLKEEIDLNYNPIHQTEIENINFCLYKKSLNCLLEFSYKNQPHIQKTSSLSADENSIANFIQDLARQSNKDPQDAKLKIENGIVSAFSLSSPGVKLDEEKSIAEMENYLLEKNHSDTIKLPFAEIQPEISMASADNLKITELIGEGRSNFRGSPKNRIFNINVATKRFDGILIKPNEEFSFVKVLGEVDGEHGYLPELVIKKDKTEPEFGGGICQVSTTAFRAAIYSGLEITARRNHAYPVSYYNPQGMDATVYVPRPDLRFINDTPGYILIQTKIEGTELIFDFYGTSDGRKTTVIGPKITERNPDGSMKAVFTQQIFDKNDNLIREDVFNSAYDSPSKYPHPANSNDILTQKPKDWSEKEWKEYKKAHNL